MNTAIYSTVDFGSALMVFNIYGFIRFAMPVTDGLAATEKIRAYEREDSKTIPTIAMTANVFNEDVERSGKAGMNAHLSKPIEPKKCTQRLPGLFPITHIIFKIILNL